MLSRATLTRVGDKVTVAANCHVTGEPYQVTVARTAFDRWVAGELAQNAFPDLSPDDREFLISGTSPAGWNKLFGRAPRAFPEPQADGVPN